jgi:hypothetical protein
MTEFQKTYADINHDIGCQPKVLHSHLASAKHIVPQLAQSTPVIPIMLPLLLLLKTAVAALMAVASFFGGINPFAISRLLSPSPERFLTLSILYMQANERTMKVRTI